MTYVTKHTFSAKPVKYEMHECEHCKVLVEPRGLKKAEHEAMCVKREET